VNSIPPWWRWLHDISFMGYAVQAAVYNEFQGLVGATRVANTANDRDGRIVLRLSPVPPMNASGGAVRSSETCACSPPRAGARALAAGAWVRPESKAR
jgi:hypothetical protein